MGLKAVKIPKWEIPPKRKFLTRSGGTYNFKYVVDEYIYFFINLYLTSIN